MKNKVIHIRREDIEDRAEEYFIKGSGLTRPGAKFDKMRSRAAAIREEIRDRVQIRGLVSYYEEPPVSDGCLRIQGVDFLCPPFGLLEKEQVTGAYGYLITGGDYYLEEREIMDQLLADIWGTAYVDAGRDALRDQLVEDYQRRFPELAESLCLSDSFGPGYYGMKTRDTIKLLSLLEGDAIGVTCRESGVMVPLKSCTGIYLVTDSSAPLPDLECGTCLGNTGNCRLCNVRRQE